MTNLTIRKFAKEKNVPLWAVADALGISEPTMTRKLRHELEPEEWDGKSQKGAALGGCRQNEHQRADNDAKTPA